jgi:hypothetical protein
MQYFHRLCESWNKKRVVAKHVGKGVIVDSEKQLCR